MRRAPALFLLCLGCSPPPGGGVAPEGDRPLAVGFLVLGGVYNSELMAPLDRCLGE